MSRYDYAPYGREVSGVSTARPGYAGHINDPDTGLIYMQARYYDPEVGGFLSVDPVGPVMGEIAYFNLISPDLQLRVAGSAPHAAQHGALESTGATPWASTTCSSKPVAR
ncbi:RHS repeat-associated core domain-containing protein [Fulvimonas soli]|uniref:RHS repeat-associated core domain-containing protein n=1 Tax=Fulvimonas soli TaxID=155197 RepID=UPI001FE60F75|nr:RHS repeat-associated core domain-containing protein [Fulvimonas soli]